MDKGRSSGFTSPIGSFRSRSPSPLGIRMGAPPAQSRAEILLNPGSHTAANCSPTSVLGLHNMTSPTLSPLSLPATRPAITTSNTITQVSHNNSTSSASPSFVTPTSAYFSTVSDLSNEPSPTTAVEHAPNLPSPVLSPSHPVALPQSIISSPVLASTSLSLPPSPQLAKKRLSFMSYSDLLSSTPAATQPLSSLTTCVSSTEPPPHIPGVSGLNIANAMQAPSHHLGGGGIQGGLIHVGKRDSIAMLDNVGGEWEREGLGRGLEERLEALVIPGALTASPVVYPVVWSIFGFLVGFVMLPHKLLIFFRVMVHPIILLFPLCIETLLSSNLPAVVPRFSNYAIITRTLQTHYFQSVFILHPFFTEISSTLPLFDHAI